MLVLNGLNKGGMMKLSQVFLGLLAGAFGAAIWAMVAYSFQVESGWIAWAIGLLVGVAVAIGGRNGVPAGILAVIITLLSIVSGKYAVVELYARSLDQVMDSVQVDPNNISDEVLQPHLAEIVWQSNPTEKPLKNYDQGDPSVEPKEFFPPAVWALAGEQLSKMSDEEKLALNAERIQRVNDVKEALAGVRQEGFVNAFGFFDLIFFGLAVYTAWKVATRDED